MFAVVQLAVYGGMQIPIGLFLDRYGAPHHDHRDAADGGRQLTLAFSPSVGVAIFARMLLGAGTPRSSPACSVWSPCGSPRSAVR
jgi:hypothetical protein